MLLMLSRNLNVTHIFGFWREIFQGQEFENQHEFKYAAKFAKLNIYIYIFFYSWKTGISKVGYKVYNINETRIEIYVIFLLVMVARLANITEKLVFVLCEPD